MLAHITMKEEIVSREICLIMCTSLFLKPIAVICSYEQDCVCMCTDFKVVT